MLTGATYTIAGAGEFIRRVTPDHPTDTPAKPPQERDDAAGSSTTPGGTIPSL